MTHHRNATPKLDRWIDALQGRTEPVRPIIQRILPIRRLRNRYDLVSHRVAGRKVTLNSRVMLHFLLADRKVYAKKGRHIIVVSSFRSSAKQKMLYMAWVARHFTGLPAAQPFHSDHERGDAIDIANDEDADVRRALSSEGFTRGTSFNDPPHFFWK